VAATQPAGYTATRIGTAARRAANNSSAGMAAAMDHSASSTSKGGGALGHTVTSPILLKKATIKSVEPQPDGFRTFPHHYSKVISEKPKHMTRHNNQRSTVFDSNALKAINGSATGAATAAAAPAPAAAAPAPAAAAAPSS
jgi:hypothetical protein